MDRDRLVVDSAIKGAGEWSRRYGDTIKQEVGKQAVPAMVAATMVGEYVWLYDKFPALFATLHSPVVGGVSPAEIGAGMLVSGAAVATGVALFKGAGEQVKRIGVEVAKAAPVAGLIAVGTMEWGRVLAENPWLYTSWGGAAARVAVAGAAVLVGVRAAKELKARGDRLAEKVFDGALVSGNRHIGQAFAGIEAGIAVKVSQRGTIPLSDEVLADVRALAKREYAGEDVSNQIAQLAAAVGRSPEPDYSTELIQRVDKTRDVMGHNRTRVNYG